MARTNKRSALYITQGALTTGPTELVNISKYSNNFAIQVTVTGNGVVSANVVVEFSNDGSGWISDSVSQLNISGINNVGSGFVNTGNWTYVRANILTLTGTNALVTASVGVIS